MISIRNILIISKFETRVLWRNWFFRIFALLALFFLTIFNIAGFTALEDESNWRFISNSWGIPYANMIMLSIGQAAAVIFLATGSIKKDKKIDTNEVFMVRSISNADYVLGKAFAIFKLFVGFNLVILTIGLICNLTNPDAPFNPLGYLIYPLLTSIPTIIFVTGVSFLVVTLLRNQPISIVLLVGISGVILIYFFEKYSHIFDYMAFRFSMMASDIVGFNNLKVILWQRSFYITLGITCLFATSLFLDRLPNSKNYRYALAIISLLLAGGSTYLMANLWNSHFGILTFRENLIAANGRWTNAPNIEIESNSIHLVHPGEKIAASSKLIVKNSNPNPLNAIYFTLNPGLSIQEVTVNGSKTEYHRDEHIVSIPIDKGLNPGMKAEVILKYQGVIMHEVAHLEVDPKRYARINEYFVFPVPKQFAFLQSDYVLLTKDVLWYPDTQIGYSHKSPVKDRTSFTNFQLDVTVRGGLVAISQGSLEIEDSLYQFKPEYPLPQISLAIGFYEKKELQVDSVNYIVYHYPGNDYFAKYFNQLQDTLSVLITDLVNEYEQDQELEYPFPRLQFVEVPIQFRAFDKIYESHQAYMQPEMVLLPEEGGDLFAFDLKRQMQIMEKQAKEENLILSEKEKQANVFKDLVKKVFTKQIGDRYFFDGRESDEPNYSLFANLYAYNSGIISREWPLFNKSVSLFLNNDSPPVNDYSRNINGISFTEECNELMRRTTIMEILIEEKDYSKIQKSVSLKGEYLFSYLSHVIGEGTFREFLYKWINDHSHQLTGFEDFRAGINEVFGVDIEPFIRQVYIGTNQPSFEISNTQEFEIQDGDRQRYQILFDLRNTGKIDGVVKVNFQYWEENEEFQFFGPELDEEASGKPGYLSVIKTGETKRLGFVLDSPPDQVSINTLVSKNIPSVVNINPGKFSIRKNTIPFAGEEIIDGKPLTTQFESIVDNEDPGFSTFSPIKATYLRQFLETRFPKDKKYYGSWRRSYSKWLATTGSDFYGDFIRSAHFTRSGKGDKITTWEPDLQESGFYDLFVYLKGKNQNEYVGRDNENKIYNYQYIVNHGDGSDEISFDLSNAERGWNYLGSYFFIKGEGNVILTDKCSMRTVYADAVKWVKQQ